MALSKTQKRQKIKRRIRRNIFGTAERPRLSVFRSNKEFYAQLIDDINETTLFSVSTRSKSFNRNGNKTEQANALGKQLAEAAKGKFDTVVFDRNGFIYHGRIKAFAEGAREGGLKF